jgi:lysophospholipase L1-like esterase
MPDGRSGRGRRARGALRSAALLPVALWLTLGPATARVADTPASRPAVLVVGDSLGVGMRPSLPPMLGGDDVVWDVRSGRTTPQGMQRLRVRLQQVHPATVVFSLGTNDGSDPGRFSSRMSRALSAVPGDACVVWININRPPRKGAFAALNRVLWRWTYRDPRLVVVDWDRVVAAHLVTLPDGLHPDPAGFAYRSSMVAGAVDRGCAPSA